MVTGKLERKRSTSRRIKGWSDQISEILEIQRRTPSDDWWQKTEINTLMIKKKKNLVFQIVLIAAMTYVTVAQNLTLNLTILTVSLEHEWMKRRSDVTKFNSERKKWKFVSTQTSTFYVYTRHLVSKENYSSNVRPLINKLMSNLGTQS